MFDMAKKSSEVLRYRRKVLTLARPIEEDDGTLPSSAPTLSLAHSRTSDLRRHQENVASVVDQLMRDYRSAACDFEAVALVEPDCSLVFLEDQQA